MAAYWPTPAAERDDPGVAAMMNHLPKIVVSTTLARAEWANTRIIRDDVGEQLSELKQQPGKDIAILGSSRLTVSLVKIGLVDEVRLMVNPVVLGAGTSVFSAARERISLRLLTTRPFDSGNVLLCYEPSRGGHPTRPVREAGVRPAGRRAGEQRPRP
jgi:dihydrofolate reductase